MASSPKQSTSSRTAQEIQLPDGRSLSFTEYGCDVGQTSAPPVFYLHGFPSSRLEGSLWHDAALKLGLHMIAIDRPGMGGSTFKPGRRLVDWPADVLALADHLGAERFSVLGLSGGGPYALACAHQIPPQRLVSAAVVSGIYPLGLGTGGMLTKLRVMLFLAAWMPPFLRGLMEIMLARTARDPDPTVFEGMLMKEMAGRPAVDRKCFEDETFKRGFVDSTRESVRNGTEGIAWDIRILSMKWGFDLEDVNCKSLTLWHGSLDANVPVSMSRKAAKVLPGAELSVHEEGHVSLPVTHAEEILKRLMADSHNV